MTVWVKVWHCKARVGYTNGGKECGVKKFENELDSRIIVWSFGPVWLLITQTDDKLWHSSDVS